MEAALRKTGALLGKDLKDLVKNPTVLLGCLLPVGFIALYSQTMGDASGEAADAVRNAADKTADAVRRMSSELARNLRSDGLLEREAAGLTAWPMQSAPRCLGRMILWRRWSRRFAAPL